MKPIHIESDFIINAPREAVHAVVTDFENMPKNFPSMAKSARYIKRDGNTFQVELHMKSSGDKTVRMMMEGEIKPREGFVSTNTFSLGVEREVFALEEVSGGTKINYTDDLEIQNPFLRLFGAFFVKRTVLRNLNNMIIDLRRAIEK
ncbi:MAG: SRPBCC family protein [Minisyncoccota bacterium]